MRVYYDKYVKSNMEDRDLYFGVFNRLIITGHRRRKGVNVKVEIINVYDKNYRFITDRILFDFTKGFAKLELNQGDHISFKARKMEYIDSNASFYYNQYPEKYNRLFYPTQVRKLIPLAQRIKPSIEDDNIYLNDQREIVHIKVPGRK